MAEVCRGGRVPGDGKGVRGLGEYAHVLDFLRRDGVEGAEGVFRAVVVVNGLARPCLGDRLEEVGGVGVQLQEQDAVVGALLRLHGAESQLGCRAEPDAAAGRLVGEPADLGGAARYLRHFHLGDGEGEGGRSKESHHEKGNDRKTYWRAPRAILAGVRSLRFASLRESAQGGARLTPCCRRRTCGSLP